LSVIANIAARIGFGFSHYRKTEGIGRRGIGAAFGAQGHRPDPEVPSNVPNPGAQNLEERASLHWWNLGVEYYWSLGKQSQSLPASRASDRNCGGRTRPRF